MSNTSNMKRHVGKISNTDQRCVVAFMQIPGRETHALVIPTDSLPPRYEQAIREVVESDSGQAAQILANVLGARLMPDSGDNMLAALHKAGYLHAIPVDNVVMYPMPNYPFPLRNIITQMGGTIPEDNTPEMSPVERAYHAEQAAKAQAAANKAGDVKFNPYGNTMETETSEEAKVIARNLLTEAALIEADAKQFLKTAQEKRLQAQKYDPSIKVVEPEAAKALAAPSPSSKKDGYDPLNDTSTTAPTQIRGQKIKASNKPTGPTRKGPAQRKAEKEHELNK